MLGLTDWTNVTHVVLACGAILPVKATGFADAPVRCDLFKSLGLSDIAWLADGREQLTGDAHYEITRAVFNGDFADPLDVAIDRSGCKP